MHGIKWTSQHTFFNFYKFWKILRKSFLNRSFPSFEVVAKYDPNFDEYSSYRHETCYSSTDKDPTENNSKRTKN